MKPKLTRCNSCNRELWNYEICNERFHLCLECHIKVLKIISKDKTMNKCPKCGSTDLNILYKEPGELYTTSWEKRKGTPYTEFLSYDEYDFYYKVRIKKEHLLKKCKTCQYVWREATQDEKNINEKI